MDYLSELKEIKDKVEKVKAYYYNEKGKEEQLISQKKVLENELKGLECNINILEKVKILLQKVSKHTREQARRQIETLVTNCLQYIFDSEIEFKIEIDEVRGRPEAEFYTVNKYDDKVVKMKPQEAKGGGVVDIISLAVRVAMLQCSNLDIKGPVIFDEPAKHVSDEYIIQVGEFLKQISRMFDRQVILVTHNIHLKEIADRCYRIESINGKSLAIKDS